MSKTKQQQRRAILEAAITPPTHKLMSVKMPIAFADALKQEANEKRMLLSGYVLSLIEKGKGLIHD